MVEIPSLSTETCSDNLCGLCDAESREEIAAVADSELDATLDTCVTPARFLRLDKAICRILAVDDNIAHLLNLIELIGEIALVGEGSHEAIDTGCIIALLNLD